MIISIIEIVSSPLPDYLQNPSKRDWVKNLEQKLTDWSIKPMA